MGRHVVFLTILTEFGRALAAGRRYEKLRYGHARHEGFAATDVASRIFEEFYVRRSEAEDAADDLDDVQRVVCGALETPRQVNHLPWHPWLDPTGKSSGVEHSSRWFVTLDVDLPGLLLDLRKIVLHLLPQPALGAAAEHLSPDFSQRVGASGL